MFQRLQQRIRLIVESRHLFPIKILSLSLSDNLIWGTPRGNIFERIGCVRLRAQEKDEQGGAKLPASNLPCAAACRRRRRTVGFVRSPLSDRESSHSREANPAYLAERATPPFPLNPSIKNSPCLLKRARARLAIDQNRVPSSRRTQAVGANHRREAQPSIVEAT